MPSALARCHAIVATRRVHAGERVRHADRERDQFSTLHAPHVALCVLRVRAAPCRPSARAQAAALSTSGARRAAAEHRRSDALGRRERFAAAWHRRGSRREQTVDPRIGRGAALSVVRGDLAGDAVARAQAAAGTPYSDTLTLLEASLRSWPLTHVR